MAIFPNQPRRDHPDDDDQEDSASHSGRPLKKPRIIADFDLNNLPEENDNADDPLGFFDYIHLDEYDDDDFPSFLEDLEFQFEEIGSEVYDPVVDCPWLEELVLTDQEDHGSVGGDEADFGIELEDLQGYGADFGMDLDDLEDNVAEFGIDLDDLQSNVADFDLNELMADGDLEDDEYGLSLEDIISIPI